MSPDPAVVARLADAVAQSPPRLGRTRLVSVDGPAGSGKTTTSAALLEVLDGRGLGTDVLHLDDLYEGWAGLSAGLEPRLLDQVLLPLAAGTDACWQRYDWYVGAFAEWLTLPPPDVLILEGCGSGALAYAPYRSFLVWLEAGPETRVARGIARAGEQVLPDWLAWMETEAAHFELNQTRRHADLVVSTD